MKHVKTFEGFFDNMFGSKYKKTIQPDYRGSQEIQDEKEEAQFQRKSEENKKIKLQNWISNISPTFWKKFGNVTDQFGSPRYMNEMFQPLKLMVNDPRKNQFIDNLSELQKIVNDILELGSGAFTGDLEGDGGSRNVQGDSSKKNKENPKLRLAKQCNPSLESFHQFFYGYNNLCSDKYKEQKEKAPQSFVVNHYYGDDLIEIREQVFDEVSQYIKKEMTKKLNNEILDSEVTVWNWRDIEEIKTMWSEFEIMGAGYSTDYWRKTV
jgi:hypothetical protein